MRRTLLSSILAILAFLAVAQAAPPEAVSIMACDASARVALGDALARMREQSLRQQQELEALRAVLTERELLRAQTLAHR